MSAGSPTRAMTMPFSSTPSTNSSRSASSVGDSATASGRSRSSSSRVSMRKTARWPPESTGFRTAGKRTASSAASTSSAERSVAYGGCGSPEAPSASRIARLCVRRCAVSRADPREPELLGDGGDDGHGAVGRDREHAVDADAPRDLDHLVDVGEVDDLGDVGRREARRLGVPVDRGDAQPPGARLLDRAALMAPGADEEHGLHGRRW